MTFPDPKSYKGQLRKKTQNFGLRSPTIHLVFGETALVEEIPFEKNLARAVHQVVRVVALVQKPAVFGEQLPGAVLLVVSEVAQVDLPVRVLPESVAGPKVIRELAQVNFRLIRLAISQKNDAKRKKENYLKSPRRPPAPGPKSPS
mgnify:CR=1 FL=1